MKHSPITYINELPEDIQSKFKLLSESQQIAVLKYRCHTIASPELRAFLDDHSKLMRNEKSRL